MTGWGERYKRFCLIADEIRWDCIGDSCGDLGFELVVASPVFHGASGAEMTWQVFDPLIPVCHTAIAESTPRGDVRALSLPVINQWHGLQAMEEPQVLNKVVFAVELSTWAPHTIAVVMAVKVL
jgi:hypothetical protein